MHLCFNIKTTTNTIIYYIKRPRPKAMQAGPIGGVSVHKSHSHERSDVMMKLSPNFSIFFLFANYRSHFVTTHSRCKTRHTHANTFPYTLELSFKFWFASDK